MARLNLEKELAEIKAMLKLNTALLEWLQQALIESNLKKGDRRIEYRD